MKLAVIGSGYVGLCTAAGFAHLGHEVICIDTDKAKVDSINSGKPHIYEDGLAQIMSMTKLKASANMRDAEHSQIIFIAVGTPSKKDGSCDLSYIEKAAYDVGLFLKGSDYCVVAIKSTVPPQTTSNTVLPILERTSGKSAGNDFGVCMNPEFLREGSAMQDFFNPDRIIIGQLDGRSGDTLSQLYENFKCPVVRTTTTGAEMIKYASNAFLATKISFINEVGNLCKKLDLDVYEIAQGMGLDRRISPHFLSAGVGFGGSCFRKDVESLSSSMKKNDCDSSLLDAVLGTNSKQPLITLDILEKKIGNLHGKRICILGLAFKEDTDDVRDAPSIQIITKLLEKKCLVECYDPKASENMRRIFPNLSYHESAPSALKDCDACLVLTGWSEFKSLKDADFDSMKTKIIIEGRRILDGSKVSDFEGVCW